MGDPRKQRRKYSTPSHPWQASRIEEEKELKKEYGFKNKKEIWKTDAKLKKFTHQAKRLITGLTEQTKKETQDLLLKLFKYSLLPKEAKVEEVLGLTIKDIAERRLQTIVFKKGLGRTINQARQFIVHGHVFIGGQKVTVPSYLVKRDEENKIIFSPSSKLSKEDHPERVKKEKKKKKPKVEKVRRKYAKR